MEVGITIVRTKDLGSILELCKHPAIFPWIADDFTKTPEDAKPVYNEQGVYLVGRDDKGLFGFAIFLPMNWVCYSAHLGFLPRSYGETALLTFQTMLAWMWDNTKAQRIVGEISADNVRAIRFVERAGCSRYGINVRSVLRRGELRDQVCLGITRS